jgi:tetratricopeptide (TPR) repeat protein
MSTEEKTKSGEWRLVLSCFALLAGTFGLFWPVHTFPFIGYDDPSYVAGNPYVQAGLKWNSIVWAFSNLTSGFTYWHPMSWMSHMLDAQLFGGDAGKHHLMSVIYHSVNVLLLFFLLRKLTGRFWGSALVAALFAWHPLQVESVAWVTERKNLLSTFFLLLTIWTYTRYVNKIPQNETPSSGSPWQNGVNHLGRALANRAFWLPLILFAFGLMSKPMLVTVPLVLLLLDAWPLKRVSTSIPGWIALVGEKVPFFVLSAISAGITVQSHKEFDSLSTGMPFSIRFANAMLSYVRYLKKLLWPNDLGVVYPFPTEWPVTRLLACVMILSLITASAIYLARRRPYVLFGWLWFLITLLPVIGLVQAGSQAMADRFLYVPMIGLLLAVIWFASDLLDSAKLGKMLAPILACVVLVPTLFAAGHQLHYWENSIVLFQRAIEVEPINPIAHYNLGYALLIKGEPTQAKAHFQKAIEISSNYADARNNLAAIALREGKPEEAIVQYEAILKTSPRHPLAHYNWGIILDQQKNLEGALVHFRAAVENDPKNAEALNAFGNALVRSGKFDEGAEQILKAVQINPAFPQAQVNAGNVMMQRRKLPEAISHFSEAVRLKPDSGEWHYTLGNALAMAGQLNQALPHFEAVVRLNPQVPDGYLAFGMALQQTGNVDSAVRAYREGLRMNPDFMPILLRLGWLEATHPDVKLRDGTEALRLATHAVELTKEQNAEALDMLAAAYAETGKYSDAAATAQKAISLANHSGKSPQGDQIEARLELYKHDRSYRMQ